MPFQSPRPRALTRILCEFAPADLCRPHLLGPSQALTKILCEFASSGLCRLRLLDHAQWLSELVRGCPRRPLSSLPTDLRLTSQVFFTSFDLTRFFLLRGSTFLDKLLKHSSLTIFFQDISLLI